MTTAPNPVPGPAAPPASADPATARALALLNDRLPGAVLEAKEGGKHPWIRVAPEGLRDACRLLRDEPTTRLDCCHLVSGVDWPARKPGERAEIEVVYHLVSYALP